MLQSGANKSGLLLMVGLVFTGAGTGCKSRQVARTVEGNVPEVLVTMQNIPTSDEMNSYLFTASDCGVLPSNSGLLLASGQVSFKIKGIKSGDSCNIRVENPGASIQELGFKSDQFLMYEAKDVAVGQNLKGQYIATAFLEKQYYHRGNQRYSLSVSVNFDQSVANKKLTADLTCVPPVALASDSFTSTSDTAGDFYFSAIMAATPEDTTCSQINVFEDKKLVFNAEFKSDKFRPKAGDQVKLAGATVSLKTAVIAPTGIIVETGTTNSTCKETEFFNTETRQCQAR
jgi:hypothetical protein